MSTKIKLAVVLLNALILGSVFSGDNTYATSSGLYGTCTWTLTDDGVLTFSSSASESCELTGYNYASSRPYNSQVKNVKKVVIENGVSAPDQSAAKLFYGMENMETISGIENLDTSNAANFNGMFFNCKSLKEIDLSHFETSKVTAMHAMFAGCSSLESLDLSHFDTTNLEVMSAMFAGCSSLKHLDMSSFDNTKVLESDAVESTQPDERVVGSPFAFAAVFAGIGQSSTDGTELILGPKFKFGNTITSKDNARVLSYASTEEQNRPLGDGYMVYDLRVGSGLDGYFEYAERSGMKWGLKDNPDVLGADAVIRHQNSSNSTNTYIVMGEQKSDATDDDDGDDGDDDDGPTVAVPDTGVFTGGNNAVLISVSMFGVIVASLLIGVLSKFRRKRIDFKRR